MNDKDLGERVARIEGTHEIMITELQRARAFSRLARVTLAVVLVTVAVVGVKIGESFVEHCGWIW